MHICKYLGKTWLFGSNKIVENRIFSTDVNESFWDSYIDKLPKKHDYFYLGMLDKNTVVSPLDSHLL